METKPVNSEYSGLILGLREGKEQALMDLRKLYFPMILDLVRHHDRAEEVFEEGLIVLYEYVCKPDFELRCKLSTLFYSICRNLFYKGLRNQNRTSLVRTEQDLELMDDDADIEAALAWKERMDYFQTVFARLGDDCRRLLTLAIVEELSAHEIMALMNYGSTGYLYKRKSQCKDKLLALFKAESNLDQY